MNTTANLLAVEAGVPQGQQTPFSSNLSEQMAYLGLLSAICKRPLADLIAELSEQGTQSSQPVAA